MDREQSSIIEKEKVCRPEIHPDSEVPMSKQNKVRDEKGQKGYKSRLEYALVEGALSMFGKGKVDRAEKGQTGYKGRVEYAPSRFEEENFEEVTSFQDRRIEDSQPGAFSIAGPGITTVNNDQAEGPSTFNSVQQNHDQEVSTGERIIEAHLAPDIHSIIQEALEENQNKTPIVQAKMVHGKRKAFLLVMVMVVMFAVVGFVVFGRNRNPEPTTQPTLNPTIRPTLYPTLQPSDTPSSQAYETLRLKLEPYFLGSGSRMFPESELHEKVLNWLYINDVLSNDALSGQELLERFVLNVFYYSSESGKDFRTPKHVCDWKEFIGCNRENSITHLAFSTNYSISGVLPTELGLLTNLIELGIVGKDPNDNETGNRLKGKIPSEIGNLKQLESLSLWSNHLQGLIPSEIFLLSTLKQIRIQDNLIIGTIPTEIGNLKSLADFQLENNILSGTIPSEIGESTSLHLLTLSNNKIEGRLPTEIGNLRSLALMRIHKNSLSGPIPIGIGNLSLLQELSLYSNELSGSFPTELGKLTALMFLFGNGLEGNLNPIICDQRGTQVASDCLLDSVTCDCCPYCCYDSDTTSCEQMNNE